MKKLFQEVCIGKGDENVNSQLYVENETALYNLQLESKTGKPVNITIEPDSKSEVSVNKPKEIAHKGLVNLQQEHTSKFEEQQMKKTATHFYEGERTIETLRTLVNNKQETDSKIERPVDKTQEYEIKSEEQSVNINADRYQSQVAKVSVK